jgi:hypothetical protein
MTELAYIVVDHEATATVDGLDGYGRRYILIPPAQLGEVRLSGTGTAWVRSVDGDPAHEIEVPIHHRFDMPERWPAKWAVGT